MDGQFQSDLSERREGGSKAAETRASKEHLVSELPPYAPWGQTPGYFHLTSDGFAYPPPPPPYLQEQKQVTVINGREAKPAKQVESFCGQFALSCFVFWVCNPIFGVIAFICAANASSAAGSDQKKAKKFGRVSYVVSLVGIIVTLIVLIVIVPLAMHLTQPSYVIEYHIYYHPVDLDEPADDGHVHYPPPMGISPAAPAVTPKPPAMIRSSTIGPGAAFGSTMLPKTEPSSSPSAASVPRLDVFSSSSTNNPAAVTPLTNATATSCANFSCYPYTLWTSASCAFGVESLGRCHYDLKYQWGSQECASSTEVDHDNWGNCYKTSAERCPVANNYNNGICYQYVLLSRTPCPHAGFYRNVNDLFMSYTYCYYTSRNGDLPCVNGDFGSDFNCYLN